MEKPIKCCRLCSKMVEEKHLQNLFERCNRKIVRHVEDIAGIKLKNTSNMPDSYCNSCGTDLEHACAFRERVRQAQKHFRSAKFKEKSDLASMEIVEMKPVLNEYKSEVFEKTPKDEDLFDDLVDELAMKEEDFNYEEENELLKIDASYQQHSECNPIDASEKMQLAEEDRLDEEYSENDSDETDKTKNNVQKENPSLKSGRYKTKQKELHLCDSETVNDTSSEKAQDVESIDFKDNYNKTKPTKKSKNTQKKEKIKIKYICDQCGNNFNCRHHFLTHLRRHAGDKPFQCEICTDKFFTNSNLKRHMRRHTGERPFACRYCDRHFNDYSSRIKHERTHTNERPFSCNLCEKAFTTSYILKNHMVIHTGERSFRCTLCDKAFQRQTNLATHCRTIAHQQNELKQKAAEAGNQIGIPNCKSPTLKK